MTMTRDFVKFLRDAIQAELDGIGETLGCKITLGACKYGVTAEFKMEVAKVDDETGETPSKIAEEWKRYAGVLGLNRESLGKTFQHQGSTFTVAGLKMGNRRYPVIAMRSDNRTFKFPVDLVKRLLPGGA